MLHHAPGPSGRHRTSGCGTRAGEEVCGLAGSLRWVKPDGSLAALHVTAGTGTARGLVGRTLTLDLRATAVRAVDRNADGRVTAEDLLPGDLVSMKLRLPARRHGRPSLVAPARLVAEPPS